MTEVPAKVGKGPARGYSWPPFEKGNKAALAHGAWSPRSIRPVAERLAAELVEVAPWVARPAFGAAVHAWAWSEAQCVLLREYAHEVGLLDEDGAPRAFLDALHRSEQRSASRRAELGLTPAAWARLLRSMSESGGDEDALEQLKAEGRRILEAREGEG